MKIFDTEGLEWRPAFKRAALFVALWLLTIYALSTAFQESFYLGLDSPVGIINNLLVPAVFFFLFFTVITAFSERRRKRARLGAQSKSKSPKAAASGTEEGEEGTGPGDLKGRHNPNTSRKKASRRRRR